ncbi:MAG TPA: CocE/NonD family hydrolase [Acetobacteraceae bacterium]|nr:CocE/NonD family hydrolase [Acetobacteraceae bacterium]
MPSIRAIRRRLWAALSAVMHAGAFDQSAAVLRYDVLVFATPPLDRDLEVTGSITVRLWIASDAPDTDFTAKLIDVYPPSADFPQGFAMNLTEGLLRVRYRDSWERPAPMLPGEVYAITIELFPTANLLCRGRRLRLDISSSNLPHFDVNPNSGEPEGGWPQPRIARKRIFAEAARSSAHPVANHPAERAASGLVFAFRFGSLAASPDSVESLVNRYPPIGARQPSCERRQFSRRRPIWRWLRRPRGFPNR